MNGPVNFAALAAAAAEAAPMVAFTPTVPGRELRVDGDGLAYYCSGNDECEPGTARFNLAEKLRKAQLACGAERVVILLTASGSHKGYRYAVARVKPYQGQRSGGRRPKNWEFLRNLLAERAFDNATISTRVTGHAEADDLFGQYGEDIVIHTQDKDMRMLPGIHLDWVSNQMVTVPEGCWAITANDKVYGRKWFWLQMLHGDTADNVPGLLKYLSAAGTLKPCGEVGAGHALGTASNDTEACNAVVSHYKACYGDRWPVEILEQGILLWMRRDDASHVFNVCHPGNPLAFLYEHKEYDWAIQEIKDRIKVVTDAEAESLRSSLGQAVDVDGPGQSVCDLQAAVACD